MRNNTTTFIYITLLVTSCVPQRKYADLENEHRETKLSLLEAEAQNKELRSENKDLIKEKEQLVEENIRLRSDFDELSNTWQKSQALNEELNQKYQNLLEANDADLSRLNKELQKLEQELQDKGNNLIEKESALMEREKTVKELKTKLDRLQADLQLREKRVNELQRQISAKDSAVNAMRIKISEALTGFEDKGIKVETKNGKVYVSMESQLLFRSGRTDVDEEGRKALLQLAGALNKDKGFEIMIEGHTDSIPIKTARFEDNWDLSVLRATSMLRILTTEGGVSSQRIIPAGRGEYLPVASNSTESGRAQNRRIEIIIAPDLSEIYRLLEP